MSELLGELFSSKVRAAVLEHCLLRPHLGFSLTDLSRRLDLPISSLQHECYKLARLEILRDYRQGASRLYQPNHRWPLLAALSALVGGAVPVADVLAGVTEAVEGVALIVVARPADAERGTESYLILVGDLTIDAVDAVFGRVQTLLGATVPAGQLELAFFRPEDWAERQNSPDDYWTELVRAATTQ